MTMDPDLTHLVREANAGNEEAAAWLDVMAPDWRENSKAVSGEPVEAAARSGIPSPRLSQAGRRFPLGQQRQLL